MTLDDILILILEIVGIKNRRNTGKVSAHLLSKLVHSWGANVRRERGGGGVTFLGMFNNFLLYISS